MKVTFLLLNFKDSGGMRVINELANGLVARGHDVAIVVPRGTVQLRFPIKARVIEVGRPWTNPYSAFFFNLPRLVFAVPQSDAVICTFSVTAFFAWAAAKILHAEPYNFVQNDEMHLLDGLIHPYAALPLYRLVTKLSYYLPVKVLVNSCWTAEVSGFKEYRIIYPGVDALVFRPASCHDAQPEGRRTKIILVIGKKQPWKGLDDLLEALDAIYATHDLDFRLIIVSPDHLRCDRPYIKEIARVQNDRELAQRYRDADLFISPSWFEGFGLPPLEAMACGTPVVLTDSGGVREYAVGDQNCVLVEPRKPAVIQQAILRVLGEPSLAVRVAEGGVQTAQRFRWEASVDALEKILQDDLACRLGRRKATACIAGRKHTKSSR